MGWLYLTIGILAFLWLPALIKIAGRVIIESKTAVRQVKDELKNG